MEQDGAAKKLTGQILLNWLTAAADGHGGISSIVKQSTSGLTKTYRITLADETTFDFPVSDGRGITGIDKVSTVGLVDTYRITYNDNTTSTFPVTNGAKGDKGDTPTVWLRYASQEPTEASHNFGVLPDDWMGICSNYESAAPTDWTQYQWYKIKGEKGDTGNPATLTSSDISYQVSNSGTVVPSGAWLSSIPAVAQGKYLWTRCKVSFNTGNPIVFYSVAHMGLDGTGAVSKVCSKEPDSNGNVALGATDVGALPTTGGLITGDVLMNQNRITGLGDPLENDDAANKSYVDAVKTYVDEKRVTATAVLAKTWEGTGPYTQTVTVNGILASDMPHVTPVYKSDASDTDAIVEGRIEQWARVSYAEAVAGGIKFTCLESPDFNYLLKIQIEVMR